MDCGLTNMVMALVISQGVATNSEWRGVADALEAKCERCGYKVVRVADADRLAGLRRVKPGYTAFVRRPDESLFADIVEMARLVRNIDDDPLEDTVWGIVSGPTAADALRVARAGRPDLSVAMSTMGIREPDFKNFVTFSDGQPKGTVVWRAKDGSSARETVQGDLSARFAAAWEELDPGLIATSFHASDRNLGIPYGRGFVVAQDGALWASPSTHLIDYSTGQASGNKATLSRRLAKPKRAKVWFAPGNCLIANNPGPGSMVMTAIGYGKCDQFFGYIVTTWYGAVGWGAWGKWADGGSGLTVAQARHLAVNDAIRKLTDICPNAAKFAPVSPTTADYQKKFSPRVGAFLSQEKVKKEQARDAMGLLWDRDTTVVWGDPTLETDYSCVTGKPAKK